MNNYSISIEDSLIQALDKYLLELQYKKGEQISRSEYIRELIAKDLKKKGVNYD